MSTSLSGYGPTGMKNGLKGTGYKQASLQQFTPEQMGLFQQLFSQVSPQSQLGKLAGGDQSQFEQLEAPALEQFRQLQGGLASRLGGSGLRKTSGFQQENNSAASSFAQQLQSQRMGLQRQALQDLLGISSSLLGQRPYENVLLPKKKSFWQELGIAGASGLGQAAGMLPFLL